MRSRHWLLFAAALVALAAAPNQLMEALEAQRAEAARSPRSPEVLNDLANLLVLSGQLEDAEDAYRRALELAPERTATRYNLALLLQESGRQREAMTEYQRVVESDPGHAWAHYQLGTLYAASDKRSRALEHYTRALVLQPDLILPEVNPHIVRNRLATEALLLAHRSKSPAVTAPRLYQQPSRIAELLVPPVPEVVEPPAAETPTTAEHVQRPRSRSRVRTRWPAATEEVEEAEGSRAALPRERSDIGVEAEEGGAAREAEEIEYGLEAEKSERRDEPELPPAGEPRQQVPPIGVISVTVPPGPVPSTGSGVPPQPGLPSTGRLDLQLLPSDSELLAELPRAAPAADDLDG